jgi:hypothetical protein
VGKEGKKEKREGSKDSRDGEFGERERGRKMYTETFLYTKHAEVFQKIT